ncbi:LOW QUALITY PROTEIN: olfactory receptor 4P4-like [Tupaia chinensis]|uniref:LOW QUALITY PROTEIN: olfactory receptor 4P4-like n=1 Tax=Tupaia chinensis TaxID=246437 RepID=UPI0007045E35|nr:LOW QUALITY PROTEIN: olfactory receptor 4P4-like [Tupaia chinensis]
MQHTDSQRNISEFILLGLFSVRNLQIFCFMFFLLCYVAILVGNLLILISIRCSALFNQPMYYFLSHLSSMYICYTSCMTPKLIGDLLTGRKMISYNDCMLQVFSMHLFGMIEIFILIVMAFDRFVVICKPLHYMIIMNRARCNILVLTAWAAGAFHSFSQFSLIIWLLFCGSNEIDHYYCDFFPLLKVTCVDTYIISIFVVANSGVIALVTFVLLFGSYIIILCALRNHSEEGAKKALSTCGSHITVVILFLGSSIFAYCRPPTTFSEDKIFAVNYL